MKPTLQNLLLGIFSLSALFLACGKEDHSPPSADSLSTKSVLDSPSVPAPEVDTLAALCDYLAAPFDFGGFMQVMPHMLNCAPRVDYLHRPDYEGIQYGYCEFNGNHPRGAWLPSEPRNRKLSYFIVYMRGPKILQYGDTAQAVLAFASRYPDARLAPSDWVGQSLDTVRARLGEPQQRRDGRQLYQCEERTLLLLTARDTVRAFRFAWLPSGDTLPEEIWELEI